MMNEFRMRLMDSLHPVRRDLRHVISGHEYAFLTYERALLEKSLQASLLPRSPLVKALVLLMIAIDFGCLYSQFNLLVQETPLVLIAIIMALAIGLDLPLSIVGNAISERESGMRSKTSAKRIISISLSVFALTFLVTAALRMASYRMTFVDLYSEYSAAEAGVLEDEAETASAVNPEPIAVIAALVLAVAPAVTSGASFVFGLKVSKPLQEKKFANDYFRHRVETLHDHLEQALVEVGSAEEFNNKLLTAEHEAYEAFLNSIHQDVALMEQKALLELEKAVHDADKLTLITSDAALIQRGGIDELLHRQDPHRQNDLPGDLFSGEVLSGESPSAGPRSGESSSDPVPFKEVA